MDWDRLVGCEQFSSSYELDADSKEGLYEFFGPEGARLVTEASLLSGLGLPVQDVRAKYAIVPLFR